MNPSTPPPQAPDWIAFAHSKRIARGPAAEVAAKVKAFADQNEAVPVWLFDALTSQPVELDLRGSVADVLGRMPEQRSPPDPMTQPRHAEPASPIKGPGRPKLGVIAREVTLLPRHWDWLAAQPGGASVSLRKLVEQALRAGKEQDHIRMARDAAYRFMSAMAGNEAGFEEATRALFAGKLDQVRQNMATWPADVREHALSLMESEAAPLMA